MSAHQVPAEVFDLGASLAASRAQMQTIERERDDVAAAFMARMQAMLDEDRLDELVWAMDGFRIVYGPGWSKRAGAAGLPKLAALNRAILGRCNDGDGRWRGPSPLGAEDPRPQRGTWVVYQLFDADHTLLYIGSTGSFPERLKNHSYTKTFAFWRAAECDDEKSCRDLESALIDRYRPKLNRLIAAPRVILAECLPDERTAR